MEQDKTPETSNATETPNVPKERFDEVHNELKNAQDQLKLLQSQMTLLQANTPATPQQPSQDISEKLFEGIFDDDDSVVDKDQLKQVLKRMISSFGSVMNNVSVMLQCPNYTEIVKEYLPKVVERNPALAPLFRAGTPESALMAYELCSREKESFEAKRKSETKSQDEKLTPEVKAALEAAKQNINLPGSVSEYSGEAALNKVAEYSKMSDEDIEKRAQEVIATGRK